MSWLKYDSPMHVPFFSLPFAHPPALSSASCDDHIAYSKCFSTPWLLMPSFNPGFLAHGRASAEYYLLWVI